MNIKIANMNKNMKEQTDPGKAPDKMDADELHMFAVEYAFIDERADAM